MRSAPEDFTVVVGGGGDAIAIEDVRGMPFW